MTSLMKEYINHDTPFGPIDASMIDIRHEGEMKKLVDQENRIYRTTFDRPSVIIGRKGSGKTAYLRSVYLDSTYDYVIKLHPAKSFTKVMEALEPGEGAVVFAELVAELWEKLFYCALFAKLVEENTATKEDLSTLKNYLARIGVRDRYTADDILWTIVDKITSNAPSTSVSMFIQIISGVTESSFDESRDIADHILSKNNKKAIILLDSLDDYYGIDTKKVVSALKGLFKCVGEFNRPGRLFDVRLCLPTELFHIFTEISANPNKDFSHRVVMQWQAKELVCVAAQRLSLYLKNYGSSDFSVG